MEITEQTKQCTRCNEIKPVSKFGSRTQKGKRYVTTRCNACRWIVENERGWRPESTKKRQSERKAKKQRDERAEGIRPAYYLFHDTRKSDRKRELENDLDIAFVEEMISQPCCYCNAEGGHMTLDRIDNKIGHMKDNVVPACYRCNIMRRDMPFEAWFFLLEGIRKAREAGAFGDWHAVPFSRKKGLIKP